MKRKPFSRYVSFRRPFEQKEAHVIFTRTPHPKSQASLFSLILRYRMQEEDSLWKWLHLPGYKEKVKEDFFKSELEKSNGKPECAYCGKPVIIGGGRNAHNTATLDHFNPISAGGSVSKPSNLVLACNTCNNDKDHAPGIVLPDGRLSWGQKSNELKRLFQRR